MTIREQIQEAVAALPEKKQEEVLHFARFLREHGDEPHAKAPVRSMKGLLAGLAPPITASEIDEARKEMWGNFPRDIEP